MLLSYFVQKHKQGAKQYPNFYGDEQGNKMCVCVCEKGSERLEQLPWKAPGCLFFLLGSQEVQNISGWGGRIFSRSREEGCSCQSLHAAIHNQAAVSRWDWEQRRGKLRGNAAVTGLCDGAQGALSLWHCKHNEVDISCINLSKSACLGIGCKTQSYCHPVSRDALLRPFSIITFLHINTA